MNRWIAPHSIFAALFTVGAIGCAQVKSSTPLSPTIAGPIAGVNLTSPPPLVPASGQKFPDAVQPLTIQFGNAETNGVRPFQMTVQLAGDSAFVNTAYTQTGITPAPDGVNRLVLPGRLPAGRTYYLRTRAEDGANTSAWSSTVAFEIEETIVIGVPVPLSPIGNTRVTSNSIELRVRNGSWQGPNDGISYHFQAARDAAFTSLIVNGLANPGAGDTKYVMTSPAPDTVVYWRARLTDSQNAGAWSVTESFRTPVLIVAPSPAPSGGPCVSSSPEAIVTCERSKYGQMSGSQMLDFMIATAKSLNANGISGGPFGILRKTGGHNCGGYSCDIICAGDGNNQRQWDVLGDIDVAQVPGWSGPKVVPDIRIDLCFVQ